jgi:GAF domain-containing protein
MSKSGRSTLAILPDDTVDPVPEAGVRRAERLCEKAVIVLGVDGAGLSMMTTAGHRGTVCATDEIARRIEDLQFTLGEGPCYDAFTGGGPILVPDVNAATSVTASSWPVFTEAVAAAGVGALLAFPLMIGAIPLGAMDFYRCRPGELSSDQLVAAWDIADAAAGSLLDLRAGAGVDLPEEAAPRGASYRLEVHQATGMISVQLGTALDEALMLLRAHAFAENLDIDDVARDVVAGRLHLNRERD